MIPLFVSAQSGPDEHKLVMVLSSYGKDSGKERPGYEFDEFSQAYLIFSSNGLSVDIASPKGGKVEADEFNREKPYNQKLLEDESVLQMLDNTKPTSSIEADDYDAIYIVGGKGAMFDLPFDPSLQDIILNLYRREGTVLSSVCHGPAAFAQVKDKEDFIVKGVEMTGFTNTEEQLFGKKWVPEFPFMLEDKLKSRGALFVQADFMLSKVAVSGKFITGQNPFSTTRSAEEVVRALGLTPVERALYPDEKSIYLIQDLLDEKRTLQSAESELHEHKEDYEIPLIAIYGYYKMMQAKDNPKELRNGMELVELTSPYFFNENLQLFLAKTYISLNEKEHARILLNELVAKDLHREEAEKLLGEI